MEVSTMKKRHSKEALEFTATTGEYFNIWIVNIFLTIVSLGVYSAWAKVRTNRYFYANTHYKGSSFEYTADPMKILKGRVLIFLIYALFVFSSEILMNRTASVIILVFVLAFIPWMINKAIKFRLRNTKFRNIRFRYNEGLSPFYSFFFVHGILNIITLFLAFPYSYNKFKKLIVDNSKYGNSSFEYEGESGTLYWIYTKTALYSIFMFVGMGLLMGVATAILRHGEAKESLILFVSGFYIFYIFIGFLIGAFLEALMKNYVWSKTTLGDVTFESTLQYGRLSSIYTVNFIAIVFSLGLLIPWAKVRTLKYKCANFYIDAVDLDKYSSAKSRDEDAFGEEGDEFLDIDIGV